MNEGVNAVFFSRSEGKGLFEQSLTEVIFGEKKYKVAWKKNNPENYVSL